jgi:transcriptional regulator with XRE-family HTH domain
MRRTGKKPKVPGRAGGKETLDPGVKPGSGWLGREIRDLRKRRGLTILDLAAAIGKSTGYVSQVERNRSAPSVADLQKVAAALGVHMSWFFDRGDEGPAEELEFIVRAGRRRKLNFGLGVTDYLLSPSLSGELELLYTTLAPGAGGGEPPISYRGEQAGIVLAGSFEITIGARRFLLRQGDSFGFRSTTPHRYRNPGRVETVIVWAFTPPNE